MSDRRETDRRDDVPRRLEEYLKERAEHRRSVKARIGRVLTIGVDVSETRYSELVEQFGGTAE